MTITLRPDPSRSARPNTYHVDATVGGLVYVTAYVAPTDVMEPREVRFTIQVDGPPRRRDRDGAHALLATAITGAYEIESAVVHHDFAREKFFLVDLEVQP